MASLKLQGDPHKEVNPHAPFDHSEFVSAPHFPRPTFSFHRQWIPGNESTNEVVMTADDGVQATVEIKRCPTLKSARYGS